MVPVKETAFSCIAMSNDNTRHKFKILGIRPTNVRPTDNTSHFGQKAVGMKLLLVPGMFE
jgi:hypothetical protein